MHPWNAPLLESFRRRMAQLPHALLIHGPRGVGKLALAERIAQLLLCEHKDEAKRPCGACEGCRWYLGGNHPDFRRIEPEALAKEPVAEEGDEGTATPARRGKPSIQIKVEQIRELDDFLNLASHRGRLRVALVHPAEEMNEISQNAVLKGLEEPPPGAMFLLVSHRPSLLLPTIRSRCVALPVPVPPRDAALKWLEGQGMKDTGRWLAYAGGAPLRALDYAEDAAVIDRLMRSPSLVDDREALERLAEVLQKLALDRSFSAFGLPTKYGTPGSAKADQAHAWLTFARRMGEERLLTRHPGLNAKLFSAELLQSLPKA